MINSLMSRMGEAQKLSIPQLQKAIQDGTLPPYVGIPLLQDKMKQQQAAQASQQQPQQPPIAQQVMQEASMHDRGVEALPSNLPTEEMYDGGIVAFAGGDLVDDQTVEDYQDQAEEDEDTQNLQAALENSAEANEGIGAIPNAGTGLKYTEPVPAGASKGIRYMGEDYDALLAKSAKDHGVPLALLKHTADKETGGLSPEKRATAVSKAGAQGFMQFMPATAKQYGIDPMDPAQSADAAGRMYKDLLGHYKGDQRLAAMGYNWGQGNVDKWLQSGAKPDAVPKETRNYAMNLPGTIALAEGGIVGLAAGGGIKYYADPAQNPNENQVTSSDDEKPISAFSQFFQPSTPEEKQFAADYIAKQNKTAEIQKQLTDPSLDLPFYKAVKPSERAAIESKRSDLLKQMQANNPSTPSKPAPVGQAGLTYDEMVKGSSRAGTDSELNNATSGMANVNAPSDKLDNSAPPVGNTKVDPYQALMDKLDARESDAKKQKTIDGYMGLLTAGLGMMGGTSPYALANIGQGALAGVHQYGESQKLSAAEAASRDKTMAALLRGKTSADLAAQTQQRLSGQYAQTQEDKQQLFHSNAYNTINKEIDAAAKARIAANPSLQSDPAAYDKIVAQLRQQQLPILKQHYKGFMGTDMPDTDGSGASAATGNDWKLR